MRILIVNVNWLGDVLLSTPAIRAIRKHFPESYLACLVPPRCVAALKGNPYLDEVISADDRDSTASFLGSWKTIAHLRKRRFDRAIFFHRSISKKWMAWLAGIPDRRGFEVPGKKRGLFLTQVYSPPRAGTHRADFFLELVKAQGIPTDGREPDFFPSKTAEEDLKRLATAQGLDLEHPYAVLHPGGNWDLKRWPAGFFTQWIQLFLKAYPSWTVVVCGTPGEQNIADEIMEKAVSARVVSLCGKTSLDVLAALLKKAKFLLSNDSGPIHLAAAEGTPLFGLFGPTSAAQTGPISKGPAFFFKKDVGCQVPCYFRSCDTRVCMEWLTPKEVFEQTKALA